MRNTILPMLVAGTLIAVPAQAQQDVWALTNARIVTVSGPAIASGTIIIRDGLIEAVGARVPVPADARVLDLTGHTVYPGLIDLQSTAGLPAAPRGGAGGGGGIAAFLRASQDTAGWQGLDPERVVRDELRPADASIREWRETGVTTALVAPTRGAFRGQAALVNLSGDAVRMVLVPRAAMAMGFEGVRGRYPTTLMGVLSWERQRFLDARYLAVGMARYQAQARGTARPVMDPELEALMPYATGQGLVTIDARSERAIRRAVNLGAEFELNYAVATAGEAWLALDVLRPAGRPVLVSVRFAAPDSLTGTNFLRTRRDPMPSDASLQWLIDHNAAALDSAGVRFALTSGGGLPPGDFLPNVRRAMRAGLSADAALRAMTLEPARVLGMDDRLGSIEAGKIANLVVTSGDMLGDSSRITMTFVDGARFAIAPAAPAATARRPGGGRPGGAGRPGGPPGRRDQDTTVAADAAPAHAALPIPPATVPRGRLVAVTNATIMTAANGTIERGTIVIRDGRIEAIGTDVAVPRGADVIDATGQWVIPGLIDSHSHMAIEGGINEGTDNLTPQVRIKDEINHDDLTIWNALAGGITTAHLLHGSANAIGGQDAVIKLRWGLRPDQLLVADAPEGIKFALGENPKGSNRRTIPGVTSRFPETRMGVEFSIAEAFERAREYAGEWAQYEALRARARRGQEPPAPRRDLFLEELAGILDGSVLVHSHSYRADEILMLIHLADSLGFRVQTFQHVLEGYKVADEIAAHGAGASTFADNWAYKLEAWDAIPYNAALMHDRGVRVSINSDSGERIRRMLQEAAKAMHYGDVSEEAALQMVTLNAAMDIGLGARIGSLEVGKDADLVIMTHHPFDPRSRVEKTMIDGIVYYDYALAPRLADQVAGGAR